MQVLALLLAVSLQAPPPAPAPVAIRNARVYPGNGAPVDQAVILIEGGKIVGVGRELSVPPEATVIDASGKVVIPGLIDASSRLLLGPGERTPGAVDQNVLDALDFFSKDDREAIEQGVVAVYVNPPSAGAINGLGAVLRPDAARTVLLRDAALRLTLGPVGAEQSTAALRYDGYPPLRQAFEGARQYGESWEKYRRELADYEQKKKDKKEDAKEPTKPKSDPRQEILLRALDPKQPLIVRIEAHSVDTIALALRLAEEFKLRLVLERATEGEAAAAAIARAKCPVVVGPIFRSGPSGVELLGYSRGAAAALVKAGVPVSIAGVEAGGSRFLLEAAAFAASRGLSREQAIATVTLDAARACGLEKTHGSIEKGKIADLVFLSGEPFESGTQVERTLIAGESVYVRGAR